MLLKSQYEGNPYIGIFCRCSDDLCILPVSASPQIESDIVKALDVEIIRTTIADTDLVGSLVAINRNGAIITESAEEDEVKTLSKHINVLQLPHRLNACGNNILAGEKAAIVNPHIPAAMRGKISDVLGVEVESMHIAGMTTVGSACVATSKGVLCHPRTSEEEQERIKEIFGVPVSIGTANYGSPLLGASMLANSKGAVVGATTTPVETIRVLDALSLSPN